MKIIKIYLLLVLLGYKLNAQNKEVYIRSIIEEVIATVDPNQQLINLKSIYYKGCLINDDTSQLEIFKLWPHSFKSNTYNDSDSITSIVNENAYYQYRNGDSFFSLKSELDRSIYYDLTKFNIFYALLENYDKVKIQYSEENDSSIIFEYYLSSDQIYKIEVDKEKKVVIKYSCECLEINRKKGYIKLKDYKVFDNISFPSREELWTESKLEEVFEYDSISVNKLRYEDFLIPDE